jgi:hypothetical protein
VSPFQLFVTALCSWIVREQDGVVAFLREENRVFRAHLRGRPLQLSNEERRRLAVLGHQLGCGALAQVAIATADTILRWHHADSRWFEQPLLPSVPAGRRPSSYG